MNTEMKIHVPLLCKTSPVGVYVVVYECKLEIKNLFCRPLGGKLGIDIKSRVMSAFT